MKRVIRIVRIIVSGLLVLGGLTFVIFAEEVMVVIVSFGPMVTVISIVAGLILVGLGVTSLVELLEGKEEVDGTPGSGRLWISPRDE